MTPAGRGGFTRIVGHLVGAALTATAVLVPTTWLATAAEAGSGSEWRQLTPATSAPIRSQATFAPDRAGSLLLFGGMNSLGRYNDTWRLADGNWQRLEPATSPPARNRAAMAYDPGRRLTVLFGGYDGSYLDDTWTWDGTNWSRVSTSPTPLGRLGHQMAYSADLGGVVLFGGFKDSAGPNLNDTWLFDGQGWQLVSTTGAPPFTGEAGMSSDPTSGGLLLYGGVVRTEAGSGIRADTWVLDGTTWSKRAPAASPPSRSDMGIAVDEQRGLVLIFSGYTPRPEPAPTDTWAWDGANWTQHGSSGPSGRIFPGMATDPSTGRPVLVGGAGTEHLADTWRLEAATPTVPATPTPTATATASPTSTPAATATPSATTTTPAATPTPAATSTPTTSPTGGPTQPDPPSEVSRLAGMDRLGTAISISSDYWSDAEAQSVVLARHDAFPDALAGTPLAVSKNGPLLLTPSTGLNAGIAAEIKRVLPAGRTVYLLGGPAALSQGVADAVARLGYKVARLGGVDRYATAVTISKQLGTPSRIFEATGLSFQNALISGVSAASSGGVVVLTADGQMPAATKAYLDSLPGTERVAVGQQAGTADPTATKVAGTTVYETARLVAERFFPTPRAAAVASGTVFADALAGGAHIGRLGGPLLLSEPTRLPAPIAGYLSANKASIDAATLYGGPAALATAVEDGVRTNLRQ